MRPITMHSRPHCRMCGCGMNYVNPYSEWIYGRWECPRCGADRHSSRIEGAIARALIQTERLGGEEGMNRENITPLPPRQEFRQVICPKCGGSGHKPKYKGKCTFCKGNGHVTLVPKKED